MFSRKKEKSKHDNKIIEEIDGTQILEEAITNPG